MNRSFKKFLLSLYIIVCFDKILLCTFCMGVFKDAFIVCVQRFKNTVVLMLL